MDKMMPSTSPYPNRIARLDLVGVLYALVVTTLGAVLNHITGSPGHIPGNMLWTGLPLWILLYLPVLIFWWWGKWPVKSFGFRLNEKTGILLLLALTLSGVCSHSLSLKIVSGWYIPLLEGFARVSEEVFFRGFVYALGYRLFAGRKHPWVWAVALSSLLFTVVHTQAFVLGDASNLLIVIASGILFALARTWSGSIVFGLVLRSASSGGLLGLLTGLSIYAVFTVWAFSKWNRPDGLSSQLGNPSPGNNGGD